MIPYKRNILILCLVKNVYLDLFVEENGFHVQVENSMHFDCISVPER